jgi:hypothetical protein
MNTEVVKPTKLLKEMTSAGGQLMAGLDRARELYVAAVARAHAEYVDRVMKITALHVGHGDVAGTEQASPAHAPAPEAVVVG